VASHVSGTKQFHHPEMGELELRFDTLLVPDGSGQRVLIYHAEPGSPSGAGIRLLRDGAGFVERVKQAVRPRGSGE
jgi:hypothetical protein